MNYYLGVDVGTSSVKSLLMDGCGRTVGTSQVGYDIIKEKLPPCLKKDWIFNIIWIIIMLLGIFIVLEHYGILEVL